MAIYPTREASHKAYEEYVKKHILCVQKAFCMNDYMIPRYVAKAYGVKLEDAFIKKLVPIIQNHDKSKFSDEEFNAYAAKFYPCEDDMGFESENQEAFNKAWEHHYMNNSHHPEWYYYRYHNKTINYHISANDLTEMLCDWVAMSMNFNQSTYDWYMNKGGKEGKKKYIPSHIMKIIDGFMEECKDKIDFREL